jgi:hypothetical protein
VYQWLSTRVARKTKGYDELFTMEKGVTITASQVIPRGYRGLDVLTLREEHASNLCTACTVLGGRA